MSKNLKELLIVGACVTCAMPAQAAMDAKSYGMGSAGVSASDYVYAPLYNPALVANYEPYKKEGIALPSYVNVHDDPGLSENSHEAAYAEQSLYLAIALPDSILTESFFLNSQEQKMIAVDSSASKLLESSTNITDFGYTLAWSTPLKYNTSLYTGFNVKIQQIETELTKKAYSSTDISTDISDLIGMSGDTDVNFDFGIAYRVLNMTFGASIRNIMKNDYESNQSDGSKVTYEVAPITTVSATFDYPDMRFTLDYDLNEEDRITEISNTNVNDDWDNAQYLKFGYEYLLHKDYTARLGFINDVTGNRSAQITLGLGAKLSKKMALDCGISYFGTSKYGLGLAIQMNY